MSKKELKAFVELPGILTEEGEQIYATPEGIKALSWKKTVDILTFILPLKKSQRRRVRKALERIGREDLIHDSIIPQVKGVKDG